MIAEDETWEEIKPVPTFRLRLYQKEWADKTDADRAAGFTRLLLDASGGLGKSTFFAYVAKQEWERYGKRTLVLANRDRLVRQSAKRMREETGLEVDIEMGEMRASPFAHIVMASIPSLAKIHRLTGFDPLHFSVVVADEAHHSLSATSQRILNYFHYGAESLQEDWVRPKDGEYTPRATIIGTTATPPAEGKKNHLGKFFQKYIDRFSYLTAVEQGWLVKPVLKTIPVKIDTTKFRVGKGPMGRDFNAEDVSAAMIPLIEKLADQIVEHASDRKTMCFLPSVECARLMADAIKRRGLISMFVSGECENANDIGTEFDEAPNGTVLSLCSIWVEGIDFISVNCIAWFRVTISEEWYKQGIFRGTRTLKGIVDDDMTAAERRSAIAASAKPDLLILDPTYTFERIDICSAYDLYTDEPEIKKRMQSMPDMDLGEAAMIAERDFLASLKKAIKKQERRDAKVINPLSWAISIGDEKLASYEPQNDRDARPVSPGQANLLRQFHMDLSKIKCFGHAHYVIGKILHRRTLNKASPGQLDMLHLLGVSDEQAALLSIAEAEETIKLLKSNREVGRASQLLPSPSIPLAIEEEVC